MISSSCAIVQAVKPPFAASSFPCSPPCPLLTRPAFVCCSRLERLETTEGCFVMTATWYTIYRVFTPYLYIFIEFDPRAVS